VKSVRTDGGRAGRMSDDRTLLAQALASVVGPAGLLRGNEIGPAYHEDISHDRCGRPWMVLRPSSTHEVAECLRLCHSFGQPIVPQGGMTGLVSAGTPEDGEIVLSTQRLARIEEIDRAAAAITAQAGVTLQQVQEAADEAGFFFPLDIGSRGSCTVGGNVSTNAGGNRVLRYGMMRNLVLGLEAVLADGTVIDATHKMTKDNAGYDLKQLFVGSEGTLGVVTRAVLALHPKPSSQAVAFCSVPDFSCAIELLLFLKGALGGRLSAFEALWSNAYALILESVPRVRAPLPVGSPLYVLVESLGSDPRTDVPAFEKALEVALENNWVTDVVIGRSTREMRALWEVRDAVSEAVLKLRPFISYDVSMPVGAMDLFASSIVERTARDWPGAKIGLFGHIGDGNIHIVTDIGADGTPRTVVDEFIYDATRAARGSISAEHGIGFQKRAWIGHTRSPQEIALMRAIKRTLDPDCLLSRGRIFPIDAAG